MGPGAASQSNEFRRGRYQASSDLFETLRKTMPCEGVGTDIHVLKAVCIPKPHRAEDCYLLSGVEDDRPLERVRKVVVNETARIERRHKEEAARLEQAQRNYAQSF